MALAQVPDPQTTLHAFVEVPQVLRIQSLTDPARVLQNRVLDITCYDEFPLAQAGWAA